jgi:YfiH family protein
MPNLLISSLPGLDCGFLSDHDADSKRLLDARHPQVATVKQVHGDRLLWTDRLEKREREADGLATFSPGLSVGVYSADCTPVLVAATKRGRPIAVMAVHAGWRGTAALIAEKSFTAFAEAAGKKGAEEYFALIGPCISFASFEVGAEVIEQFPGSLERGLARFDREEGGQKKYFFNLPGENERQLKKAAEQAGVTLRLDSVRECTLARKDLYPSFRRDREKAGRILSYICFAP